MDDVQQLIARAKEVAEHPAVPDAARFVLTDLAAALSSATAARDEAVARLDSEGWNDPPPSAVQIKQVLRERDEAIAERDALRAVLENDVYPKIASRVITLDEAGEDRARDEWNRLCQKVRAALAAVTADEQEQQ